MNDEKLKILHGEKIEQRNKLSKTYAIPDFCSREITKVKTLDGQLDTALVQTEQLKWFLARGLPDDENHDEVRLLAITRWCNSVYARFVVPLLKDADYLMLQRPELASGIIQLQAEIENNLQFMSEKKPDQCNSFINDLIIHIRSLAKLVRQFLSDKGWIITAGKIKRANPEMTDKAIAARLDIDPSTLCKSDQWKNIRKRIEAEARASRRG